MKGAVKCINILYPDSYMKMSLLLTLSFPVWMCPAFSSEEKRVFPKQPSASLLGQLSNESASHFCDGTKMRRKPRLPKKKKKKWFHHSHGQRSNCDASISLQGTHSKEKNKVRISNFSNKEKRYKEKAILQINQTFKSCFSFLVVKGHVTGA